MAKKGAAPEADIVGRKVDAKEFGRHLALARELGLTAEDMQEEVQVALEHLAEVLNGGGLEEQLAFLLHQSGPLLEEHMLILAKLKEYPAPSTKKRKAAPKQQRPR
jgi:hypothetical protein